MTITIKDDEGLCIKHGKVLKRTNFYQASSTSLHSGVGYVPVCKNCINKEFKRYMNEYDSDSKKALYNLCRLLDICYTDSGYESAVKAANDDSAIFGMYMRFTNSLGGNIGANDLNFDSGENMSEDVEVEDAEFVDNTEITEATLQKKKEIIDLLEYDPFEGYSNADQNYLYNDLIAYFADEEVKDDQYLVSQIVQVVNNNNTIRKYDLIISKLSATEEMAKDNRADIKAIASLKKDIVANTDKMAKENGISVKNRQNGGVKKNTLTSMMEYLRSVGFSDAEVDYYDQRKAYGMSRAAKISMKAIKEQLMFDENDINDILETQRELIKQMEDKILDLEEEMRKLIKLLVENNIEYNAIDESEFVEDI